MNNNAFVFTGFAFLLVIPAVILAASFANMLELGGKATSTALRSDLVFYASNDIKSSFEKTSCNLVYTYGNNVTQIGQFLNTTWADLIEKNYTQKVGVNVSLQRSGINVYDNATLHRIEIGRGGVPLLVTDLNKNVAHNSTLGPVISSYNNPPSTPTLLFPISGWTTRGAVTLDWTNSTDAEGDNVTYQVQVDSSNNYTKDSYLTVNLSNGVYNWKVKATDGIENLTFADVCASTKRSSWTASWNFTVNSSARPIYLDFAPPYPCKQTTGPPADRGVRVLANISDGLTFSPLLGVNGIVKLYVNDVLEETGILEYVSSRKLYGNATTDTYWKSVYIPSAVDTVNVTVYAMKDGYASNTTSKIALECK